MEPLSGLASFSSVQSPVAFIEIKSRVVYSFVSTGRVCLAGYGNISIVLIIRPREGTLVPKREGVPQLESTQELGTYNLGCDSNSIMVHTDVHARLENLRGGTQRLCDLVVRCHYKARVVDLPVELYYMATALS